jgi:hypothetical protein
MRNLLAFPSARDTSGVPSRLVKGRMNTFSFHTLVVAIVLVLTIVSCGGGGVQSSDLLARSIILTVAGNYALGPGYSGDGGAATSAQVNEPTAAAVDKYGNLYISDSGNSVIRKVDTTGKITTVAGNYASGPGYSGDGASATAAQLNFPVGVAVDLAGNLYAADSGNSVIRKVDTTGKITTVAGNYASGPGYSGDGASATAAQLNVPLGVAVDFTGNLYVADSGNSVIRKVDTTGKITTVAGNYASGPGYSGDGASATAAQLRLSWGVAVDLAGNLYVADSGNSVIRKVDTTGKITTVAGNYALGRGYSGDGASATAAQLDVPLGVAIDFAGNLYVADNNNNVIRKIDAIETITTVAGNHTLAPGYSGDDNLATNARLAMPWGVATNNSGDLFILDTSNNVCRKIPSGN